MAMGPLPKYRKQFWNDHSWEGGWTPTPVMLADHPARVKWKINIQKALSSLPGENMFDTAVKAGEWRTSGSWKLPHCFSSSAIQMRISRELLYSFLSTGFQRVQPDIGTLAFSAGCQDSWFDLFFNKHHRYSYCHAADTSVGTREIS